VGGRVILEPRDIEMSMTATKIEIESAAPVSAAAPVVAMTPKRPPRSETYARMARETAVRVVPPIVVIALLTLVWELVCRRAGSALPPPSKVFSDTRELIFDPFFDHGGIDKGLFWHLSASLQRVALGYSLSAVAGIVLSLAPGVPVSVFVTTISFVIYLVCWAISRRRHDPAAA
jgi:nitrate/nitrite transport system permease protein